MEITLTALIDDVEQRAPTAAPLDQLETAAARAGQVADLADSLLSHFVDRSRRAGHSWTEIGASLGVTKQAVQKRFTADHREPRGWERFTERTRRVIAEHAGAVAQELGHNYVGTEHLLAAMWSEPQCLAARALERVGVTRELVIAGIDERVERGHQGIGGFTPRAWVAIEASVRVAVDLGHNYVGTEHVLLSMMTEVGGLAVAILSDLGVTAEMIRAEIVGLVEAELG